MKDLAQLKKDYKKLGKTIAELETQKTLTIGDLKAGTFFYSVLNGLVCIKDHQDGYTYLDDGCRYEQGHSVNWDSPVVICDREGIPLHGSKG